eukprot:2846686-Prymnesium_polylepis.1
MVTALRMVDARHKPGAAHCARGDVQTPRGRGDGLCADFRRARRGHGERRPAGRALSRGEWPNRQRVGAHVRPHREPL